jgi:DNA polymerase-3 subunit gamma/tau
MNWGIKYRPHTFDEVVGNTKTVCELKKRIIDNNIPKVVLFSGYTGTGKTTLQYIYIKSLLCENIVDGNCCNICKYCKAVDSDTPFANLVTYNGSNLNLEEMRNLEETASRKILGSKNIKIFQIDEMQEVNVAKTQKAILKLLEKPNDNCYFVLGTMQKSKIDAAILNRSLVYNLSLEKEDISKYLISIINKENVEKTIELAKMVATITAHSNNSLRTAISILERVVYSNITNEEELYKELGIISEESLNMFINGMFKGNINILQTKPDQSLLDQIKQKLILLYEFYNGMTLNEWQKAQVKGIDKVTNEIINIAISVLNELSIFPYLNQSIIEYQIIKVIMKIKEELVKSGSQQVKRGR